MNSDCEKCKDQIADLATGILPETQVHELEQHLNKCATCRDYACALKDEDMLLTEFFAKIDTNITHQQERVLQAINRSGVSEKSETRLIWRIIMKSPLTKIAIAAVVTIACLIGLSLWRTTGSGIALADVLAQIEKVEAVRYKSTFTMTGLDPDPNNTYSNLRFSYTYLASGEYGWKEIGETLPPNGGKGSVFQERYFLPQKKTFILISPAQKKYHRRELNDAAIEYVQKETNIARNPFLLLKEVLNTKYESIGRSTIDGVEVEGFRTTDPNLSVGGVKNAENLQTDNKIWVDVKTRLPVRYDCLTSLEVADGTERRNLVYHSVMYDFQWDVPVDASEFEPNIPADYTLLEE